MIKDNKIYNEADIPNMFVHVREERGPFVNSYWN